MTMLVTRWLIVCLLTLGSNLAYALDNPPQVIGNGPDRYIQGRRENPFEDVDPQKNAWVYMHLDSLQRKGILVGYPDGNFRGSRTLTRYELAWALDRAIAWVLANQSSLNLKGDPGPAGPSGGRGPQGAQGEVGPRGERPAGIDVTIKDLNDLIAAGKRFAPIIDQLGRDVNALEGRVGDLRTRVDLAEKNAFHGGIFLGIRADRANGDYIDGDGHVFGIGNGQGSGLLNTPVFLHQFNFGLNRDIPGGARFNSNLVIGNYSNFLNNEQGALFPFLNTNPDANVYLDSLNLVAPFGAVGKNGNIRIGRFSFNNTPLTFWKPDVDQYFPNPLIDDGMFRIDGVQVNTQFGSLNTTFIGGLTKTVTANTGSPFNSPLAGLPNTFAPQIFLGGTKPFGQPFLGQSQVDKLAGITLGLSINQLQGGYIRFSAFDTSGTPSFGSGFNNVLILGSDFDLNITDRLNVNAEWAKTITGQGIRHTVNPYENNAFIGNLGYSSGGLNLSAGYRYIDPLFYAPGYWDKIGNWYNPTNIQGPTFRAGYNFSPSFGLNIGGDFFTAARNRGPNNLEMGDDITRVLAGIRWDINKKSYASFDWEGVFWSLDNSRFGGSGTVHPTEQYYNIGYGFSFNPNTSLRLLYQIGDFDGHRAFGPSGFRQYNFNTFTGSLSIKY